jgi:hypothetical protein
MLLALTCIGCTKFLDKNPENKVSIDDLFSDMEGAKAALAGVYIDLWSTDYYNGARMVYPEIAGGNIKPVNSSKQTLMDIYTFTVEADSSSMNNVYAKGYAILNNLNTIINRVTVLSDGLQSERNDILAQAYGLRALLHLDLVQLYAQPYAYTSDASHPGIVLAKENITVGNAQLKRASVADVYAQIKTDLQLATDLFASSKSVFTGNSTIYFNNTAAKALQARAALNCEAWEDAYDYSTAVINDKYSLYTNGEYINSWVASFGKETIFELAVPSSFSGNSLGNYYVNETANSYYQFAPSGDLLALYEENDVRSTGGTFKYPTYGTAATTVKMIRLSEIYLIRAEAAAQRGQTASAIADLDKIRLRGNPNLQAWTDENKTTLLREIGDERRRELCLEGFFLFDLLRRQQSLQRNDCEGDYCNLSFPSDRFILPIPLQSVNANRNMEQNPGY